MVAMMASHALAAAVPDACAGITAHSHAAADEPPGVLGMVRTMRSLPSH